MPPQQFSLSGGSPHRLSLASRPRLGSWGLNTTLRLESTTPQDWPLVRKLVYHYCVFGSNGSHYFVERIRRNRHRLLPLTAVQAPINTKQAVHTGEARLIFIQARRRSAGSLHGNRQDL